VAPVWANRLLRSFSLPVWPVAEWLVNWTCNCRAATLILTKIRKFRDIRAGQKGPKSDQKVT